MKKLLLIFFIITFVLNVKAAEYDINDYYDRASKEELTKMGIYYGKPLENKIIGKGDMYVIIHNPTELSLTVMEQEANDFCKKKSSKYNYITYFMRLLGRYTAYYSCEMENKVDQYDLTDEEKRCIVDRFYERTNCLKLNSKNSEIIDSIELQNTNEAKYKKLDFIYSIKTEFYDQIQEHEQAAEDRRVNIELKRINKQIKKHIEICNNYTFEEGSQLFGECILKLLEIENNYLTIEKLKNNY